MRPGGVLSLKRRGYRSWAVVRGSRVMREMASFMVGEWVVVGVMDGGGEGLLG